MVRPCGLLQMRIRIVDSMYFLRLLADLSSYVGDGKVRTERGEALSTGQSSHVKACREHLAAVLRLSPWCLIEATPRTDASFGCSLQRAGYSYSVACWVVERHLQRFGAVRAKLDPPEQATSSS